MLIKESDVVLPECLDDWARRVHSAEKRAKSAEEKATSAQTENRALKVEIDRLQQAIDRLRRFGGKVSEVNVGGQPRWIIEG